MLQSLRKLADEFNRDRWSTYALVAAIAVGLTVFAITFGISASYARRPGRILGWASLWGIAVGLWIYAGVVVSWLILRLPSAYVRLSPLVIAVLAIGWALNTVRWFTHADWFFDVAAKTLVAAPVVGAAYVAAAAYAAWVSKGTFR